MHRFLVSLLSNIGRTLELPTLITSQQAARHMVRQKTAAIGQQQFPWRPLSPLPSRGSLNCEWKWDDSYKLFPNLVISYFHAEMDIGLQVSDEGRVEMRHGSFLIWRCRECCSMDSNIHFSAWFYCTLLIKTGVIMFCSLCSAFLDNDSDYYGHEFISNSKTLTCSKMSCKHKTILNIGGLFSLIFVLGAN